MRKRTSIVMVRVYPEEKAAWKLMAAERGTRIPVLARNFLNALWNRSIDPPEPAPVPPEETGGK